MNQPTDLPGVRDYAVRIPVSRDGSPVGDVFARIPARDAETATFLAVMIAAGIASRHNLRVDAEQITAEDVDHTTSPDGLAAQLASAQQEVEHWRRVVAGLAAKMPGLLQLTGQEYRDADPNTITVTPLPDETMMFMVASALTAPAGTTDGRGRS